MGWDETAHSVGVPEEESVRNLVSASKQEFKKYFYRYQICSVI